MKKYIAPSVDIYAVVKENILAGSDVASMDVDVNTETTLSDDASVGSKENSWSFEDED